MPDPRTQELAKQLQGGKPVSPAEELLELMVREKIDPAERPSAIRRRNSSYLGEKMNKKTNRYEDYQTRKKLDMDRIYSLYGNPPEFLVRKLMNNPELIGEIEWPVD